MHCRKLVPWRWHVAAARMHACWCNCTSTLCVHALGADARHVKGYNESSCAAIIASLAYTRGKHAWIALWHDYCRPGRWRYTVTSRQYSFQRYVTQCVYSIRNYSALRFVHAYKGHTRAFNVTVRWPENVLSSCFFCLFKLSR